MKKALVFRTAQMYVIYNLIEKLERKGYRIWCITQESSLDTMKKNYPNISYFVVDDGFFEYKKFKADKNLINKINAIKFNRVFVPSSTYNFNNFSEVRRIVYNLRFKRITYFVSHGKAVTMNLSLSEICAERIIKSKYFLDFIILSGNIISCFYYVKNRILPTGGR